MKKTSGIVFAIAIFAFFASSNNALSDNSTVYSQTGQWGVVNPAPNVCVMVHPRKNGSNFFANFSQVGQNVYFRIGILNAPHSFADIERLSVEFDNKNKQIRKAKFERKGKYLNMYADFVQETMDDFMESSTMIVGLDGKTLEVPLNGSYDTMMSWLSCMGPTFKRLLVD